MHKYPSDTSRSQFAIIASMLESLCKTTAHPELLIHMMFFVEFYMF